MVERLEKLRFTFDVSGLFLVPILFMILRDHSRFNGLRPRPCHHRSRVAGD